jgi:hypothetical protein
MYYKNRLTLINIITYQDSNVLFPARFLIENKILDYFLRQILYLNSHSWMRIKN